MTPKLCLKDRGSLNSTSKIKAQSFANGSTAPSQKQSSERRKSGGVKVISVFRNFGEPGQSGSQGHRPGDLEAELETYKQKLQKTLQINREMHSKFETLEAKYSKLLDLFEKTNKRLLQYKSELDTRKDCGTCNFKQRRKKSENRKKLQRTRKQKKGSRKKVPDQLVQPPSKKKRKGSVVMKSSMVGRKKRKRDQSRGSVRSRRSSRAASRDPHPHPASNPKPPKHFRKSARRIKIRQ